MGLKERTKEIKITIPALVIALKRNDTPFLAKFFAGLTLIYALSPIDLIPDFIPVLGYLDDVIILPVLASIAIRLIPEEVLEECKIQSANMWGNGKPKKWYFAIPTLIIWFLLLQWIISMLVS